MSKNQTKSTVSFRQLVLAFSAVILLVLPAFAVTAFGIAVNTTLSGSMQPHLNPGDLSISNVVHVNDLQVGEVVLMMNKSTMQPQSHRVTSITQTADGVFTFMTKGDANKASDGSQVLDGRTSIRRVAMIIPNLGFVTDYIIHNRLKTALMIFAMLLLILVFTSLISSLYQTHRKHVQRSSI